MGIIKYIPNTITSMNLISGVVGVISVFHGRFDIAFYLMIAAAVFDFCDGLAARALNAYSELGKQLDSLSDLVSFGLLPAMMLHCVMTELAGNVFWSYLPLMISVFAAFRLAKFNIDDRQTDNFIGLAVPAAAMICGSFVYYITQVTDSVLAVWAGKVWMIPAASLILSLLMVSEIPMFSMKIKKGISRKGTPLHRMRVAFVGVIAVSFILTALLDLNWSFAVLLVFLSYIVINLVNMMLTRTAAKKQRGE